MILLCAARRWCERFASGTLEMVNLIGSRVKTVPVPASNPKRDGKRIVP
jgi:hypothetical protein